MNVAIQSDNNNCEFKGKASVLGNANDASVPMNVDITCDNNCVFKENPSVLRDAIDACLTMNVAIFCNNNNSVFKGKLVYSEMPRGLVY